MQTAVRVVLTIVLLVAAGFLSYDMASYYLYSPWTRDARVRADVVSVAPDVSGYIDDIRVQNDQFVHKGDLLFVVDQERYRIALADAEAGLEARRSQHQMLRAQYERRAQLNSGITITAEALDNARSQADTADANYQQAVAARDNAALNLKRTEVRAPVSGFITNLNLAKGTYVSQAKPVMALIDSDSYRVRSLFRRNQDPTYPPRCSSRDPSNGRQPHVARNSPWHRQRHYGSRQPRWPAATFFHQPDIYVGPTGTADSRPHSVRSGSARRVYQCRNDLHRYHEGRRRPDCWPRNQESHGGYILAPLSESMHKSEIKPKSIIRPRPK